MIVELESGTDVACHVLYDPAAVEGIGAETALDDPDRLMLEEPRKGNVLLYDVAADGATFYRIYVDEELPEELAGRPRETTEGLLLRVPSGRLVASGMEYINDERELAEAEPFLPDRAALVTCAAIPPGRYLVDAHEFDWDWDEEVAPVLRQELGAAYRLETTLMPTGCILILVGLIGLAAGLYSLAFGGEAFGQLWLLWVIAAGVLLGPLLWWVRWRLTPEDYFPRRRAIEARFAPNALVLTRLPDDADLSGREGGGFGFAFRERMEAEAHARTTTKGHGEEEETA